MGATNLKIRDWQIYRSDGRTVGVAMNMPAFSRRILVLGVDTAWTEAASNYFADHGLLLFPCPKWDEYIACVKHHEPDMVLLGLQKSQGISRLMEFRQHFDIPVVTVTDRQQEGVDRILALEFGADESVDHRVEMRELVARVRAIFRRIAVERSKSHARLSAKRWRFEGWELSERLRKLHDPAGLPVSLTKGEYSLLRAFVSSPQRPLSREFLLQATKINDDVFDRSIDVQVLRLRRKLQERPDGPNMIRTERGIGYFFAPAVERI